MRGGRSRRANCSTTSPRHWSGKKEKYFGGPSGVATFALTVQVLGKADWTPGLLKDRQADLLGRLTAEWKLDATAP